MIKMVSFGAAVLAATLVAPLAGAAELKIGYINVGRLVEESPQAKVAQQTLEAKFMPRQRDLAAQQKALKEKEEKLQRDAAVMSEEERGRAERELRDGQRDLARRFNELQEDANLSRNEEFGKVQRVLLQEVQAFARANGYHLIISDGALFAAESIDVTPQVLGALKAKAPK